MRRAIAVFLLISLSMISSGCGETLHGVGRDVGRMGKGINTFFFRQP